MGGAKDVPPEAGRDPGRGAGLGAAHARRHQTGGCVGGGDGCTPPRVRFRDGSDGIDIAVSRHHAVSVSNFLSIDFGEHGEFTCSPGLICERVCYVLTGPVCERVC